MKPTIWPDINEKTMNESKLSASAERLAQLAIPHFADRGYDAASMNDIAGLAGLKKATLYAHFSGKDDLYQASFDLALSAELLHVKSHFQTDAQAHALPGLSYWWQLQQRFTEHDSLRFVLRSAFYPPAVLRQEVMSGFNRYLSYLRSRIEELVDSSKYCGAPKFTGSLVEVYMAAVDSLYIELIYGDELGFKRRVEAFERLFEFVRQHDL